MTAKDRLNHKFVADSATYAHLRGVDPELPDHAWRVILRYQPHLSPVQWSAVREFTIANALQMKPRTYEVTRRLMCISARFTAWVWATTGAELTAERVFTQANIYRYLQECLPKHSESHRWGVVRQLGTIAEALADTVVRRMPAPRLPGRRPFTVPDVARMHSWAGALSTPFKRQNAWAILGLAGGAGLRTEELIDVRLSDIEVSEGRLFVNVPGKRARRIPVMHPWNRTLLRSVEGRTDPVEYAFRGYRLEEYHPRAIQNFLSDNPASFRATVSRLRSTWIITQINNGLPMTVLVAAAGFSSADGLIKHLPHAKPVDIADFAGLLSGEEVI